MHATEPVPVLKKHALQLLQSGGVRSPFFHLFGRSGSQIIRHIIGFVLKNPKVLFSGLRFLTFGGKSPSLIVKKKGQLKEEEEQVPPVPTFGEDDLQ